MENEKALGVGKLTLFAISTTLASGVFSLAGDFAASGAHTLAVLIGWAICGVGMLGLATCFYKLGIVRPNLSSGIFNYAKEGFGNYFGFINGWGYFISAILTPVSYIALLFATLGNVFDIFGDGNNLTSVIVGSIFVLALVFVVYRGISSAVGINALVITAKLTPIVFTLIAILFLRAFKLENFLSNFAGSIGDTGLMDQVKSTVTVTVWTFVGIEGAVVLSARAKSTKVAGKATIYSFISLFCLYLLISALSMGVLPQEELAKLTNPSMAGIMEYVVGPWGAHLIRFAVILSVGGAMFSYIILCTDCAYQPSVNSLFPKFLSKLNKHNTPTWGVLATGILIQFFLIMMYINSSSYQAIYSVSTSTIMLPYFFSALYYLKLCVNGDGLEDEAGNKMVSWLAAIIGTIYGAWLIYAIGIEYLLITSVCYAPGTIFYFWSRKENGEKLFSKKSELVAFIIIMAMFLYSVYAISSGTIKIL